MHVLPRRSLPAIAVLQLARAASGLPVTVGTTTSIPLWASWIACFVAAGLAWLGFDASRSFDRPA
jgi:hypothetical protein